MRSRIIGGSALLLAAFASGVRAQAKQGSSDSLKLAAVRRAIDAGNAEWSAGWATRDGKRVAAIFAPDGVQLAGSGKIFKGRAVIAERQHAAMLGADSGVRVTVTTTRVWLDGDTAYETGTYKYAYTDKGAPGTDEGKYVTVWHRQKDGSWKLAMDLGLPNG